MNFEKILCKIEMYILKCWNYVLVSQAIFLILNKRQAKKIAANFLRPLVDVVVMFNLTGRVPSAHVEAMSLIPVTWPLPQSLFLVIWTMNWIMTSYSTTCSSTWTIL